MTITIFHASGMICADVLKKGLGTIGLKSGWMGPVYDVNFQCICVYLHVHNSDWAELEKD